MTLTFPCLFSLIADNISLLLFFFLTVTKHQMTKAHKCHYERILNAIQCMYITPEHLTLLDLVPFKSMIFRHFLL